MLVQVCYAISGKPPYLVALRDATLRGMPHNNVQLFQETAHEETHRICSASH